MTSHSGPCWDMFAWSQFAPCPFTSSECSLPVVVDPEDINQGDCSSIQKWIRPRTSLRSGSCYSSVPLDSVFYAFAPRPPHIGDMIWTQLPSGPIPLLVWLPRELTQSAAPVLPASLQHMALQAENCPLRTLLVCGVIGNWLS